MAHGPISHMGMENKSGGVPWGYFTLQAVIGLVVKEERLELRGRRDGRDH